MSKSINEESIFDDKFSVKNLQFRKIINTTANNKEKHREILVFLCFHLKSTRAVQEISKSINEVWIADDKFSVTESVI